MNISCLGASALSLLLAVALVRYARSVYRRYLRDSFYRSFRIELNSSAGLSRDKTSQGTNWFCLTFPYWLHSNNDGTRDKRCSENDLVRPNSELHVEGFLVKSDLVGTVWLANTLRAHGVSVNRCPEEELKYQELLRWKSKMLEISSIKDIYEKYPDQDFELLCADLFRAEGCRATVTKKTGDGGHDIEVEFPSGETAIVECKCYGYGNNVGGPVLRNLYGSNAIAQADRMIVVTTSQFTSQAKDYACNVGIELVDGPALLSRMRKAGLCGGHRAALGKNEWQLTWEDLSKRCPKDFILPYSDTNAGLRETPGVFRSVEQGRISRSSAIVLCLLAILTALSIMAAVTSGVSGGSFEIGAPGAAVGAQLPFSASSNADEYVLPNSDTCYYAQNELEQLGSHEIVLAINELYARHGRVFYEEEYANYFEAKSWYEPRYLPEEYVELAEPFNEFERENLRKLVDIRTTRGI